MGRKCKDYQVLENSDEVDDNYAHKAVSPKDTKDRVTMPTEDVNSYNKTSSILVESANENKEEKIDDDEEKIKKKESSVDKVEYSRSMLKSLNRLSEEYYRDLLAPEKSKISPFRLIKYSYPVLNRVFSSTDITRKSIGKGDIGIYHNKKINISDFFKTEIFIGLNLHSFISCMDANCKMTVLGLKTSLGPFDIFEVRQGPSKIVILDQNLRVIKKMDFNFGDVVSLKIVENSLVVLFGNGNLIEFADLDENKPDFKYLGPEKIVAFDARDNEIIFTNGTTIFSSSNKKINFEELVVGLAVGTGKIYLLSVTGKIYTLSFDFQKITELHLKQRFRKIEFLDNMLIATEDSENASAVFIDKANLNVFTTYFLAGYNGVFRCFKNYRTSKRSKEVFQIFKSDNVVHFLDNENSFDPFQRSYIPNIKTFADHFLFTTDYGLIMKIFYI